MSLTGRKVVNVSSKSPTPRNTNQNITRVVRVLMAFDGIGQQQLAARLDWDKATMSRTLNDLRKWTPDDIIQLSEVFERPVGYFFESADSLVRSRCFSQLEFDLFASAA
jgi:transcriptional regulator with XRE-family HTH domain